ncbi:MAG TPA: Crp/Fnr family transcriptional regulator [Candidatus Dormibacteraeota bacterium]|nr:Crp/Fnr family transcriptional regulator [Candidatus Dormibacteraeota bacterium]
MSDQDHREIHRSGASRPEAWRAESFLGRLEPGTRESLLRLGKRCEYPSGQMLLQQGEESDHVILIRSGIVKISAGTEEGHTVLLGIRMSGDIVGELAAMDGAPRSATLLASGKVVGQRIERSQFQAFLRSQPDIALLVTRTVGDRLRMANRRRVEFGGYSVKVRVARILVELGRSLGRETRRGMSIDLDLTHPELAQITGAAVVSVQKALRELRRQGLITTGYRHVTILDFDGLLAVDRRPGSGQE